MDVSTPSIPDERLDTRLLSLLRCGAWSVAIADQNCGHDPPHEPQSTESPTQRSDPEMPRHPQEVPCNVLQTILTMEEFCQFKKKIR